MCGGQIYSKLVVSSVENVISGYIPYYRVMTKLLCGCELRMRHVAMVVNSLQSLQITAFMMTVCHVLIVVVDWFIDINLLRLVL